MIKINEPQLIEIPKFTDDRGQFTALDIINATIHQKSPINKTAFVLPDWKRAYIIQNNQEGVIRAFHGHKKEAKLFFPLVGTFRFILMPMSKTGDLPDSTKIKEFIVSADVPKALFIPNRYYNGFVNLTANNLIIGFSSSTVEESQSDDFRVSPFVPEVKDLWKIKHR